MTKENKINKWVGEWYEWLLGEVMNNIAKDGMKEYGSDLLHTVILDLYNLPADKITQMVDDDKLRWYVLRDVVSSLNPLPPHSIVSIVARSCNHERTIHIIIQMQVVV